MPLSAFLKSGTSPAGKRTGAPSERKEVIRSVCDTLGFEAESLSRLLEGECDNNHLQRGEFLNVLADALDGLARISRVGTPNLANTSISENAPPSPTPQPKSPPPTPCSVSSATHLVPKPAVGLSPRTRDQPAMYSPSPPLSATLRTTTREGTRSTLGSRLQQPVTSPHRCVCDDPLISSPFAKEGPFFSPSLSSSATPFARLRARPVASAAGWSDKHRDRERVSTAERTLLVREAQLREMARRLQQRERGDLSGASSANGGGGGTSGGLGGWDDESCYGGERDFELVEGLERALSRLEQENEKMRSILMLKTQQISLLQQELDRRGPFPSSSPSRPSSGRTTPKRHRSKTPLRTKKTAKGTTTIRKRPPGSGASVSSRASSAKRATLVKKKSQQRGGKAASRSATKRAVSPVTPRPDPSAQAAMIEMMQRIRYLEEQLAAAQQQQVEQATTPAPVTTPAGVSTPSVSVRVRATRSPRDGPPTTVQSPSMSPSLPHGTCQWEHQLSPTSNVRVRVNVHGRGGTRSAAGSPRRGVDRTAAFPQYTARSESRSPETASMASPLTVSPGPSHIPQYGGDVAEQLPPSMMTRHMDADDKLAPPDGLSSSGGVAFFVPVGAEADGGEAPEDGQRQAAAADSVKTPLWCYFQRHQESQQRKPPPAKRQRPLKRPLRKGKKAAKTPLKLLRRHVRKQPQPQPQAAPQERTPSFTDQRDSRRVDVDVGPPAEQPPIPPPEQPFPFPPLTPPTVAKSAKSAAAFPIPPNTYTFPSPPSRLRPRTLAPSPSEPRIRILSPGHTSVGGISTWSVCPSIKSRIDPIINELVPYKYHDYSMCLPNGVGGGADDMDLLPTSPPRPYPLHPGASRMDEGPASSAAPASIELSDDDEQEHLDSFQHMQPHGVRQVLVPPPLRPEEAKKAAYDRRREGDMATGQQSGGEWRAERDTTGATQQGRHQSAMMTPQSPPPAESPPAPTGTHDAAPFIWWYLPPSAAQPSRDNTPTRETRTRQMPHRPVGLFSPMHTTSGEVERTIAASAMAGHQQQPAHVSGGAGVGVGVGVVEERRARVERSESLCEATKSCLLYCK
ncbi:unnamed protein product [Vitrella brassicaformis CCMP3155]|uniref:Uncharacterized protein n=2 Tax=Vitrella brassicaformis TaxID=1169539 RepID=A0A0G4F2G3_VITBC|nr:unnamed protein product [Vitrella brassicaformis CCMP3155]|eukprot:CEM06382.1 unnamed protein product [Vitrella brassicaformis CCMP3155]